jgi:predicted phage-related endonuclease
MSRSTLLASMPDESAVPLDHMASDYYWMRGLLSGKARFISEISVLEAQIKAELGDAEFGTIAGQPVVSYRRALRIGVSQQMLKAQFPAIVPLVQDITEVRTFRMLNP